MDNGLKCEYCGYKYHGRASSLLMLHECSDQEMHYIDRADLTEEPLPSIPDIKEPVSSYRDFKIR